MYAFKTSITFIIVFILLIVMQLPLSSSLSAEPANPKLSNDRCLRCHGKESFSRKGADGEERDLHVTAQKFDSSVHGKQDCVGCHLDIIKAPCAMPHGRVG